MDVKALAKFVEFIVFEHLLSQLGLKAEWERMIDDPDYPEYGAYVNTLLEAKRLVQPELDKALEDFNQREAAFIVAKKNMFDTIHKATRVRAEGSRLYFDDNKINSPNTPIYEAVWVVAHPYLLVDIPQPTMSSELMTLIETHCTDVNYIQAGERLRTAVDVLSSWNSK